MRRGAGILTAPSTFADAAVRTGCGGAADSRGPMARSRCQARRSCRRSALPRGTAADQRNPVRQTNGTPRQVTPNRDPRTEVPVPAVSHPRHGGTTWSGGWFRPARASYQVRAVQQRGRSNRPPHSGPVQTGSVEEQDRSPRRARRRFDRLAGRVLADTDVACPPDGSKPPRAGRWRPQLSFLSASYQTCASR